MLAVDFQRSFSDWLDDGEVFHSFRPTQHSHRECVEFMSALKTCRWFQVPERKIDGWMDGRPVLIMQSE